MAIIAMTQHLGTRAFELGRLTAQALGYRFLTSDQIIAEASQLYGVKTEDLVIVDERRPHFWERLKTDTARVAQFFRAVVLKEMAADRLVVIGRSVTHMMPECGCGIRVRLTAPLKARVRVVGEEEGIAPAVAERRVREFDRETRARIQTLLDVDLDDPANFSLTVNTAAAPLEVIAATLGSMARQLDELSTDEDRHILRDAAIAAEVHVTLMSHPKIGRAPLVVQCAKGMVLVNGPGLVPPWDGLINEVASQIKGVRAVEVRVDEQPIPVRPS
jgi:cytidylate kinase